MATNPFAKYVTQADPVIAVDPYKVSKERRDEEDQQRENERFQFDQAKFQYDMARDKEEDAEKAREIEEKRTKADNAKTDAVSALRTVIDKVDEVAFDSADNGGLFETGRSGAFVRSLPEFAKAGTAAYDLAENIKTIDANSAFNALAEMRANSPTGGALGQVTEKELELLKSSIANLNPNQSQGTFFSNLAETKRRYLDMLRNIDPALADEYAKKKGIRWDKDGAAVLVSVDGDDDRDRIDPLGLGGGGSGGGNPPPDSNDPLGSGGLSSLAKQGITLGLADEASGIGGAISSMFTGEDPLLAYRRERDAERARVENARRGYPIAGAALEFLAGGGAGRVTEIPNALAGVVRQGAAFGGVGGFGYGEDAGSIPSALIGAGGGAALGAGAHRLGNALATRAANRAADRAGATEIINAGQRQNIPIRQPDARPELRGRYAAAESTQNGGPAIRATRAADNEAIENRVAQIGGDGTASDPYALGSRVQEAGRRYIARTRAQANRLYETARQEAGETTVTATNADAVIDANIRELQAAGENSNAAAINYLQGLRDDIDRGLTLDAVQNLRTNMRGQISERGLTGTDTDRRVMQVIDAMNRDLTEQLPQSASQALRAADNFYRQRQEFITGTLQQFMGSRGNPLAAETAASRLVSMAQGKGNYQRFSNMWRELEPAEQADAAATIAASLGRRQNGDFSPAILIKSLDPRNGINPRTARLIFGDDGARALDDLRIIARAKGEAMNRQSPSGQAIGAQAGNLKTFMMGALGFSAGGPGGAAAGAVGREFLARWGEQRAARMLLNPDFTRWLRQAPSTTNPRVIDRYFSRLAGMGSVAANDNQAFTRALMDVVRNSPGRAAADDEPDTGREPPQ